MFRRLRAAVCRACVFAIAAVPAVARADASAPGGGTIVVTGTRIPAPESERIEPVAVADNAVLAARNHTNVADALNELPGYRGSVTPAFSQASFGQGANFINAFGLGSARTLTLVDGRRVVSSNVPSVAGNASPGTQADLNAIPAILVDRVERVAIGGAPVYGTDAIAATINVILRRRLTGLETRATAGVTSQGDAFRWNLSAAGGVGFAQGRGNLTAAIGYDRAEGVVGNARSIYRANLGNATNPCTTVLAGVCPATSLVSALGPAGRTPATDGRVNPAIGFNATASDGIPGAVLIRDLALPSVTPGGVLSSGGGAYAWRFATDGALVPHARGMIYGAPVPGALAAAALASGGDGLRFNDYLALASTTKRLNAALFATFDVSDRLSLFADGLYYHGQSDELVQTPAFNATAFGGQWAALSFRVDNPFLSQHARTQLAALGYRTTFQLSRSHDDLVDLTGWSDSRLYRVVAGARGKLAVAGSDWDFEASANWGRSDVTDHGEAIDQQRFVNAVNVAMVGGRIACTTTPTVTGFPAGTVPVADPACQPLDLFGNGAPSPAALAYIRRETLATSRLEQLVLDANIGGSPFAMFGNPVSINLGFEHHAEKARFTPDAFLQAGLGRSAAVAPTRGSYRLDEAFGEVLLPLVTPGNGLPIARLTAFGRARQVWSSTGADFTAWSAGGLVAPVEDVELRGNFTRSFRAPSITELYSPRAVQNVGVPDLCSAANIGSGPVPDIRRANCTAFLARYPGATPLIAATASVPALTGGNPALKNEDARSFTYGAVLRPRFLPGLSLAVDYLSIRIDNPIASLTATQIAQGCFDNADFDAADPAQGNPFCALIRRNATGQVVSDASNPGVITGFVNGKRIRMSGVQATLDWRSGALAVGGDLFHLRRRVVDVTGVAPARSDGIVGDPRWQGQLRLAWAPGPLNLSARINYTGGQAVALTGRGDSPNDVREIDHFRPFATLDMGLGFVVQDRFRLTLTVTNLLNRMGQEYMGYIVPLSVNDAIGRRFAVSAGTKW